MALNDPYSTAAELARERGRGIESAFGTLASGAGVFAGLGQENQKRQRTMDMMKQFGILTEEEQPYTIDELKKIGTEKFGNLQITGSGTKKEQADVARRLLEDSGIVLPKRTIPKIDLDVARKAGLSYNMGTGEAIIKPEITKFGSIADVSNLTPAQQIQARQLARKISGVRGAENILPSIVQEMTLGKSIDQVEDSLRYSGQSGGFSGPIRNATQTLMMTAPESETQRSMDYMDDLLSKGDTEGVKSQLKRLSIKQAGAEEGRSVVGKERTIKLLDEIQTDLNNLESMGINTNIFTGTQEKVAANLGTVVNPEARKLVTKISAAVQNYRRSMTGVQFGMPENKEYKVMFPDIGRTANFNTANISALKEVMSGDLDNFYGLSMGEDNYNQLFKTQSQTQQVSKIPTGMKMQRNKRTGETRLVPIGQ